MNQAQRPDWTPKVDAFTATLEAWGLAVYSSVEVTVLELFDSDRTWKVARATAVLSAKPAVVAEDTLLSAPHLRVRRCVFGITTSTFQAFLQGIQVNRLKVGPLDLLMAPGIGDAQPTFSAFNPNGGPTSGRPRQLWLSGVIRIPLARSVNGFDQYVLDAEVMAIDPPWLALQSALDELGIGAPNWEGDTVGVLVVGLCPAVINARKCVADADKVHVAVAVSSGLEKSRLTLSLVVRLENDQMKRQLLTDRDLTWSIAADEPGHVLAEQSFSYGVRVRAAWLSVNIDALSVHADFLSRKDRLFGQRSKLLQVFDSNLDKLRDQVLSARGKEFEFGVSSLLFLLGFVPCHIGGQTREDGPDIVALTPRGSVLLVECTTGPIAQENKLAKLVKRRKAVADAMAMQTIAPAKLLAVVVAQSPRDELSAELRSAAEANIAVVTREDVLDGLSRLEEFVDTDALFDQVASNLVAARAEFGIQAS
jgi:hypothetical protein